jgi:hypothetical protein
MEYTQEILWYLSLPVMLMVSYRFVLWSVKKFEANEAKNFSHSSDA